MIEHLRPGVHANDARVVLFDFDGTLSLIRTGWVEVMVPQMVGILAELKTGETEEELRKLVEEFVARLTGRETIYQMIELAEQIRKRGGQPEDPKVYKKMYLDALHDVIKDRLEDLRSGKASPEEHLVPGSRALLEDLKARGLKLYLASGTDHDNVVEEAKLLDVYDYFDGGVFGALDDLSKFSKALLVKQIVESSEYKGEEFLGFGDGYVEIEVVKQAGGVAVGVASEEPACQTVDSWKRNRLAGVGADFIIPNYANMDLLREALFPKS
ncbi:HAD family hydrolase [Bryobacter aggregatus]|uniref:HAD family hydrolase n=1 Tax=Bryobacter aggregatus TaxID=360054 RepID=UPI0004E0D9A8|nr:HAD family hydrolase [Bryobacter aggregatus]